MCGKFDVGSSAKPGKPRKGEVETEQERVTDRTQCPPILAQGILFLSPQNPIPEGVLHDWAVATDASPVRMAVERMGSFILVQRRSRSDITMEVYLALFCETWQSKRCRNRPRKTTSHTGLCPYIDRQAMTKYGAIGSISGYKSYAQIAKH